MILEDSCGETEKLRTVLDGKKGQSDSSSYVDVKGLKFSDFVVQRFRSEEAIFFHNFVSKIFYV